MPNKAAGIVADRAMRVDKKWGIRIANGHVADDVT